jgi:hypothetical protein
MSAFDFVAQFARVLDSSMNPKTFAIQVDLGGIGSFNETETDDSKGEVSPQSEVYGALGFVGRPRNKQTIGGKEYYCETLCMRTSDGLVPISWRDLRLNSFFPNGVPEGRIGMVGYGGGFHTIDLTADNNGDQKTSIHFIYAPYSFSNGTPSKAMAICLDTTPGAENISMSIGGGTTGFQMTMNEADGVQIRTPNTNTMFNIREDEINLSASKILLKGNVYIGSNTISAVPLLAGPASPPCPTLFLSPV